MAIKTGTITARPTRYGANTKMGGLDGFLSGTADLKYSSYGYAGYAILYGFNFEELRDKKNVQITDISLTFVGNAYSGSSIQFRLVTNFNTSGTNHSSYTDLGDGQKTGVSGDSNEGTYVTNTITADTIPNSLSWIKNNLTAFLNGYTSNTFGVWIQSSRSWLKSLSITVTYTYEVTEFTVSTAVSPEGAGTVTPATQTVEEGSTATVTATPNAGYKFSHWLLNGADSGITTPTLSGTITDNILCTAVFVLDKINTILIDNELCSKILCDLDEVKAILIDTTKVYG